MEDKNLFGTGLNRMVGLGASYVGLISKFCILIVSMREIIMSNFDLEMNRMVFFGF